MKFDKETIIILSICVILLIVWPFIFKPEQKVQQDDNQKNNSAKTEETQLNQKTSQTDTENIKKKHKTVISKPEKHSETETFKEKTPEPEKEIKTAQSSEKKIFPKLSRRTMENEQVVLEINPNNGTVEKIKLKQFDDTSKKEAVRIKNFNMPGPFKLNIPPNMQEASAAEILRESENKLSIKKDYIVNNQPITIKKHFLLEKNYQIKCDLEIINRSSEPIILPEIKINGGSLPPVKLLTGDEVRLEKFKINYCNQNDEVEEQDGNEEDLIEEVSGNFKWISVNNKYFACLLKGTRLFDGGVEISREKIEEPVPGQSLKEKFNFVSVYGVFKSMELSKAKPLKLNLTFYIGPKELKYLSELAPEAEKIMHVSMWAWFEPIALLMMKCLNFLHKYCKNWGLSIILLTLIVRGIFWPITQKAHKSMRRMQKIQPLVKDLREKYKDKPQEMNAKMMELYKEHHVNPLGGCLPLLLQLPIFISLYSALNSSVELRHQAFLWAQDLSKPDLVGPEIAFGLGIHPFIIIMTALMVLQQRLTPSGGDSTQKKMMMAMPFVMLVFLYSLPAGLTLYWTVSNTVSIIQVLINKKMDSKEETAQNKK